MSEVRDGAETADRSALTGSVELARNALGLPQMLFLIVAGAAPLAAMMFNDSVAIRGVGIAAPAAFWVAMVAIAIFLIGYVEMARRVTTAGGFYSFISHGFGRVVGLGAAIAIGGAYAVFVPGINGQTAYFANTTVASLIGPDIDWRIYAFALILITFTITYFHVDVVAKVLGIFLIAEVVLLMLFSLAVLVQGGADGISFAPLDPTNLINAKSGSAFASLGGAAAGIGVFAAFWSWVGFETAPNYAEEARNPRKMIAYALYSACFGLGFVYTFVTWMLVNSYGGQKSTFAVAATYYGIDPQKNMAAAGYPHGDTGNVFYPVAKSFLGFAVTDLFKILIVTSSFAACLAFWGAANRYLFAMGREGILPRMLGRTHSVHKSPFIATGLVAIFACVVTGLFATGVAGGDYERTVLGDQGSSNPLIGISELATWLPFQGVLIILPAMVVSSLAIVAYFLRAENTEGRHWLKTILAPIVGAAPVAFAVYLMVQNRAELTGSTKGFVGATPWIALGLFVLGVLLAVAYYYLARDRYDAVGRFVNEQNKEA
jgi:amino acid transporter